MSTTATKHQKLLAWVEEAVQLCQPASVHWCDGSENCACIKPKPFFLNQAAREHGLDLSRSFVIGDHPHDVELARNAGATGIYVLTGHGLKHRPELSEDAVVAANIGAAADWILTGAGKGANAVSEGRGRGQGDAAWPQ